ncbi:head-tail connector protein [Methylobacterium fujisawaense]|uniref:head-tail connector protein n=1 Tax=Methylobacterium fujisawaense TaxID=107400 RepID=UPI0036FA83C1
MIPLRIEAAAVEPVGVPDLRAYLRFESDAGADEDGLLQALISAARASLEIETRRILIPGRYRIALSAWPPDGQVPLPVSPLVALLRAGFAEASGGVTDLAAGLVRLGPDPGEAPSLRIDPAVPDPAGRTILIEVAAGYGGDGPPLPEPLRLAILRLAAARYEHRGDEPDAARTDAAELAAPFRRMRL